MAGEAPEHPSVLARHQPTTPVPLGESRLERRVPQGAQRAGPEEGEVRMRPLTADDPMTLWSAAVGDAAAAMKGGLSLVNAREAGCGSARARAKGPNIA